MLMAGAVNFKLATEPKELTCRDNSPPKTTHLLRGLFLLNTLCDLHEVLFVCGFRFCFELVEYFGSNLKVQSYSSLFIEHFPPTKYEEEFPVLIHSMRFESERLRNLIGKDRGIRTGIQSATWRCRNASLIFGVQNDFNREPALV